MHSRPLGPAPDAFAGAILQQKAHETYAQHCLEIGLPVVEILPECDPPRPHVKTANFQCGKQAANHLLRRGIKHFVALELFHGRHEKETIEGFKNTIMEQGLNIRHLSAPEDLQIYGPTEKAMVSWMVDAFHKLPKPMAVFCPTDREAHFAMEALLDAQLNCPEDVAILATENNEEICEFAAIPMSSVDINLQQVGYEASKLLHQIINKQQVPQCVTIDPIGVVERSSTHLLASSDPLVHHAITFIKKNLAKGITIEDAARHVGVSHTVLYKHFHESIGTSPGKAATQIRIETVINTLRNGPASNSELASQVGYATDAALSRAFRSVTGETLRDFRNRLHQ